MVSGYCFKQHRLVGEKCTLGKKNSTKRLVLTAKEAKGFNQSYYENILCEFHSATRVSWIR